MLKTIRLKNFKLHEDTSIEAAPITVFIGPNNSGKSSIFQALLLLRQAAARNDQFLCQSSSGEIPAQQPYQYPHQRAVDVGAFDEVVRTGGSELLIQISGVSKSPTCAHDVSEASAEVTVQMKGNRLVYHSGSVSCLKSRTEWQYIEGKPIEASRGLELGDVVYRLRAVETFRLTQPEGYTPTKAGLGPETVLMYREFSDWIGAIPSRLLGSVHPVYALRGFEEWGYPITDSAPPSPELMTLHDRALALPNALASDRRLKEKLSERLEDLLKISIDFEVVTGKRLKIWAKHTDKGREGTLFANEGAGANQIPFIFVPVLLTPPNETILLSEPEAHLHPKGQCELIRMLLTIAKKENIQFFFETHSEHVLHIILNAVARGEWSPADVALYYFAEPKKGIAEVGKREINQFGQVDGGLPDFFEQSLAELTDYLKALSKT